MGKQNKFLEMSVGIYNTQAELISHKNGGVTVKLPYVKWTGNSGSLAFTKIKLEGKKAEACKNVFNGAYLVQSGHGLYDMSLAEFLDNENL